MKDMGLIFSCIISLVCEVSDGFFQVQEQNDLLFDQRETDQARVGDGFPENGGGRKNPFRWHFENPVDFRNREGVGFTSALPKDHSGVGLKRVRPGKKGLLEIRDQEARPVLDFLIKGETGGLAEVAGEFRFPELEIDNFNLRGRRGI